MLEPRVIPCLLLDGPELVKTTRFADPVYVGDPVNVLSIFNDFEVDEIVLLDIRAARDRTPTPKGLLAHYAEECFIPLAYGGGIESVDQIRTILRAGYEKVVMNTALETAPEVVQDAAAMFGTQAIVGAIDVRSTPHGPRAFSSAATRDTGFDPVEWAVRAEALGVGEILLTAVDREGTMSGFDLELVAGVCAAVGIPVIAHGGAGKRKELGDPIQQGGASAVAAGSLFVFQGAARGVLINYPSRRQLVGLMSPGRQE